MPEKDESNEKILIDDEEKAKQEFLEELRNKNLEETIQLKKIQEAIKQKLDEKEAKKKEAEDKEAETKEVEAKEVEAQKIEDKKSETGQNIENQELKVNEKKEDKTKKDQEKKTEIVKSKEPALAVTSEAKATLLNMEKKETSFLSKILMSTVVDTAVSAVVSIVGVLLFNLILRLLAGYYIVDYEGVFIIAFLIVSILYPVVMQNSKFKKTFGQKFSKIHVEKGEE